MVWKPDTRAPVSVQITEKLRLAILNGIYPPGSQFPTVRHLAAETSVNPNTVQKALAVLEAEGFLECRGTVGRFVTGNTGLLEQARKDLQHTHMRALLEHARELGITGEMLIQFIAESEGQP